MNYRKHLKTIWISINFLLHLFCFCLVCKVHNVFGTTSTAFPFRERKIGKQFITFDNQIQLIIINYFIKMKIYVYPLQTKQAQI